jgi:murein L,D-transpeptidase YafK
VSGIWQLAGSNVTVAARGRRLNTIGAAAAFAVISLVLATIPRHGIEAADTVLDHVHGMGVDEVVVWKRYRLLSLMRHGKPVVSYRISLGWNPEGHKQREGDGRTPEGIYVLDRRSLQSQYYRSIHISYPNDMDRLDALRRDEPPGGNILIHGLPNNLADIGILHTSDDWTNGCIAVTNEQMDVIWESVADGTPIDIRP